VGQGDPADRPQVHTRNYRTTPKAAQRMAIGPPSPDASISLRRRKRTPVL
jgi:hypothetical protein